MRYQSTRAISKSDFRDFESVLMATYAPDGGLYVPEYVPRLSSQQLNSWIDYSFPEVCSEICSLFSNIDKDILRELAEKAFLGLNDGVNHIPMINIGELVLLDVSQGATLAFKDIGLSMIGQLLEYILKLKSQKATIVVETSGDTGPAAIAGVKGSSNVQIFCLYPMGRVSEAQELQMVTAEEDNVFVYRTDGSSDEQASVLKELFGDHEFIEKYNIISVNSINWVRIMVQSSYYVWSYLSLMKKNSWDIAKLVNFIVPSGAFGNAMSAYLAKLMGIPVGKIICATNANDIVHRTITYGDLSMGANQQTFSPAMDIQFAYNLERMLYFASDENSGLISELMTSLEQQYRLIPGSKGVSLDEELLANVQDVFVSCAVNNEETLESIRSVYEEYKVLLCPHSAVGVHAGIKIFPELVRTAPTISILTAHPSKFEGTIYKALGSIPIETSSKISSLREKRKRYKDLSGANSNPSWREEWIEILRSDIEKTH